MFKVEDFEIIDFHVHPFEDMSQCIGVYGSPGSADEFDAEMRRAGVDLYAGSIVEYRKDASFEDIKRLNRTALRLRDRYKNYIPGIHVHGSYPEESCAELHEMKSCGVNLVGELVPYILGTGNFNTPGMLTIFKEMEKLDMTASLHGVTREEAEFLAENLSDLKIVFAHPGEFSGKWNTFERMEFISHHPNMYMDISGTGLFRWNFLRCFIDRYGAEKLIFGSDMPICSVGMNVYGTLAENLTADELKLIFSGNARRLLGI